MLLVVNTKNEVKGISKINAKKVFYIVRVLAECTLIGCGILDARNYKL